MSETSKQPAPTREEAVTQAYLRRITGYDVTEVQEEYKINADGEAELKKRTEKTKHVPGDPRAAEFWLTNRQSDRWRYRRNGGGEEEEPLDTGVVELPPIGEVGDDA